MSTRRAYVDPATNELILMIRQQNQWIPDLEAMTAHRHGNVRVFNPFEDLFISTSRSQIGGQRVQTSWPMMQIEEEPLIRILLDHPWISMGEVYGSEVPIENIDELDQELDGVPTAVHSLRSRWDEIVRPQLSYEHFPLQIRQVQPRPVPSAPPPQPQVRPLPHHVSSILLERAEQEHAVCPISTEPITRATGSATSCGHLFQTEALRTWLSRHSTCPECRQPCAI
jgi:hypothetical protein